MKDKKKSSDDQEWLVTYGDLITLILVFFILLYAISSVNKGKFKKIANMFSNTFGGTSIIAENGGSGEGILDLGLMVRELNRVISKSKLNDSIVVATNGKNIIIRGKGDIFFNSGSAKLTPQIKKFLSSIAPILKATDKKIEVIGHTDDLPIKSKIYPSNWELSSARACSVIRYLINKEYMDPHRFKASGYAQYKPLYPPIPANRAKNRRIEIVIKGE